MYLWINGCFGSGISQITVMKEKSLKIQRNAAYFVEIPQNSLTFFYDRKLYLFDTFDGFDESDIEYEKSFGNHAYIGGGTLQIKNYLQIQI